MSEEIIEPKIAEAPHNTHPEGYNEHCPECLRLEEAGKAPAPTGENPPATTGDVLPAVDGNDPAVGTTAPATE